MILLWQEEGAKMYFYMRVHEAASNLISHALRSFLALLGILVGTASVLAIVSGGELATQEALKQFEQLGTNLLSVAVYYDYPSPGKSIDYLDLNELNDLPKSAPEIDIFAPYALTYGQATYKGKYLNANLAGVGKTFIRIAGINLLAGRLVSLIDNASYFCVLGYDVYNAIGLGEKIIGEQVLIGKQYFTVVGVLAAVDNNPFLEVDVNNTIFVPEVATRWISKDSHVNHLLIRTKPGINIEQIKQNIENYVKAHAQARLYFNSSELIVKNMKKQRQIFTVFLGFIGGISLLVGGVGIMNIMLISITERRQEIGIRMAVGANQWDIMLLFLVEAVILALFGGILGIVIGEIITFAVATVKHWSFHLFLFPLLLGFSVSMLTGIFFGFYPSYKASKLKPIETLRAE